MNDKERKQCRAGRTIDERVSRMVRHHQFIGLMWSGDGWWIECYQSPWCTMRAHRPSLSAVLRAFGAECATWRKMKREYPERIREFEEMES